MERPQNVRRRRATAPRARSTAALTGANTATPSFVPDLPGRHVVQLVVNDGTSDSDPDTVTINLVTLAPHRTGPNQMVLWAPS
ncbi:hypothetical protein [Limnochorda pilosa]|uniref:Uncharacterized protein n=1 Tax=Limnochorda pilosa TaxID=1555112 RepID=A0A0K2SIN7_LIMPI|nr:hypothetical protein [Limnochorda pilosa]BAS26955.1 hypothetical protein LIP_1098 [Limnochorda pilosa]